ncbi:MAG: NADH-quinone oxidoreductase subunit L [Chloroflexota bacterium]|nr:NADH-quinone oxidoreductase subunit L [Dehalococcoidia bacterium]MDW8252326.1 NADH-quinone oxidoreductase subunit L [Chloroflexota bacterium]
MTVTADLAWLILFLPLLAFLLNALVLRGRAIAAYVSTFAVGAAFLLSLPFFFALFTRSEPFRAAIPFIQVGQVSFPFSIQIDALTAVMLVVVTGVSFLVHLFSIGYMAGDPGYSRYFAYLSLFSVSMLGLVLAQDLVLVYVGWELVGLSSFLLVGFWYAKPSAAEAAKKAFITTRIGDFGFAIALMALFVAAGTTDIPRLIAAAEAKEIAAGALLIAALGLFAGAIGKSAQFPLHVWLPDAMEGPTPVSALIHAATMVAAGVYLVARTFPLFEAATGVAGVPAALTIVAWIGAVTALFAATIALVQTDIKKVLAYSTISQLGYMMLGLGVGSLVSGIFHLFTHAFFKALLFLAAGSVIHGAGTQDMREMGGLRRFMPVTFAAFVVGALALAGVFPFAGFWSKDEIIAESLIHGNVILFVIAEVTAFLTAFYIMRLLMLTFFGAHRGAASHAEHGSSDHRSAEQHGHDAHPALVPGMPAPAHHGATPHESPWVMTLPLMVLMVPATVAGFWALGGGFHHYLHNVPGVHGAAPPINLTIAALSTAVALAGLAAGWFLYAVPGRAAAVARAFGPVTTLLERKYYLDELYDGAINLLFLRGSRALGWFDTNIVDGVVNGLGTLFSVLSEGFRRWQTGRVQYYGIFLALGAVLLFVVSLVWTGGLIGR